MNRDFCADPTPRMLAAEKRREDSRQMEDLIERSSLGTPGAKALAKFGRRETLTPEEAEAMEAEMHELEAGLSRGRRR